MFHHTKDAILERLDNEIGRVKEYDMPLVIVGLQQAKRIVEELYEEENNE